MLYMGVKSGVIAQSGPWFAYQGNKIGQGREDAEQFLYANPQISCKIEKSIREIHNNKDYNNELEVK